MLILTRKPGESLYIIDGTKVVKVIVVEIKGNQIRLGIEAPVEQKIYREEIYLMILEENRKAAQGGISDTSLDQLSGDWKGLSKGSSAGPAGSSDKKVSLRGQAQASRAGTKAGGQSGSRESSGTASPVVGGTKES
jgi:carbon storage regulator